MIYLRFNKTKWKEEMKINNYVQRKQTWESCKNEKQEKNCSESKWWLTQNNRKVPLCGQQGLL